MTDFEKHEAEIDEDIANSFIALKRAAKKVHERAKRNGDSVIIYKDGQVVEWFPATDTYNIIKPTSSSDSRTGKSPHEQH
jgi:hypothetical protein